MFTESQAIKLIQEAESKLNSFFAFFNENRHEQAIVKYTEAANIYKYLKKYNDATAMWNKIIEIQMKTKQHDELTSSYIEISTCYKLGNMKTLYFDNMRIAIDKLVLNGSFSRVARLCKEMAEFLEKDDEFLEQSIVYYEKASQCYQACNSEMQVVACDVSRANLLLKSKKYPDASQLFYACYVKAAENKLAVYGSVDYAYKSLLCYMACENFNIEEAKGKLEDSVGINVNFDRSKEFTLLTNTITAIEDNDVTSFEKALRDYDKIKILTPDEIAIFTYIKNKLRQGDQNNDDFR